MTPAPRGAILQLQASAGNRAVVRRTIGRTDGTDDMSADELVQWLARGSFTFSKLSGEVVDALDYMREDSHSWMYGPSGAGEAVSDARAIADLAASLGYNPATHTPPSALAAAAKEVSRGSHSLARHGPQLGESELKERLTTGYVAGQFVPAGSEGYATGFASADGYLESQNAAEQALQVAYDNSVEALDAPLAEYRYSIEPWIDAGMTGPTTAAAQKAKRELAGTVGKLNQEAAKGLDFLPVDWLNPKDPPVQAAEEIALWPKYQFVIDHHKVVGKGFRVKEAEKEKPAGHVQNPMWTAGKKDPIWSEDQLQSMGDITRTKSTFNPPNLRFLYQSSTSTWRMPQHFPDNGAEGWRN